ncbi:MAG TPA: archease [Anaerolineaceae bacterium]|nr:archease [Anaerolineaceae bacterium]HQN04862.1 archease [Anaerolineaceae bacterium]HQP08599.1 archease [Anaerolineaceae bacterium]
MHGYQELSHTADWAVRVWADDLAGLFSTAADAMAALMGVQAGGESLPVRAFSLQAEDTESLLVAYLNELLYIIESERVVAARQKLNVSAQSLSGEVWFQSLRSLDKEIKAVTFSNMKIISTAQGFQVEIVFDV